MSLPALNSMVCVGSAISASSFSRSLSLALGAELAELAVRGLEKLRRLSAVCCLSAVLGLSCRCLSAVLGRSGWLWAVLGLSCEDTDFCRCASDAEVLVLRSATAESFLGAPLLFLSGAPRCDLERVRPMMEVQGGPGQVHKEGL